MESETAWQVYQDASYELDKSSSSLNPTDDVSSSHDGVMSSTFGESDDITDNKKLPLAAYMKPARCAYYLVVLLHEYTGM